MGLCPSNGKTSGSYIKKIAYIAQSETTESTVSNSRKEGTHGFINRRGFIQLCAASAATSWLPACEEWRSVGYRPRMRLKTPYITPNDEFYMVAVDPSFRPAVNPHNANKAWSLAVRGLDVRAAVRFAYSDLINNASRQVPYTFECIGNPVGGELIGNARWHVVPLKDIIKKAANGTTNVKAVLFEGLDDFYSSVSVERALDDYAFVAVKMNNQPLPAAHGFPARVILPDLYGMKQPRWLRSITLLEDADTTSYWEKRGWAGEVPVKTTSRIDPRPRINVNEYTELTGISFAGERGIQKVEVSLDGGNNWRMCELVSKNQPQVWSLWRYLWRSPLPGKYSVKVRATDSSGALQIAEEISRFPNGASGYDEEFMVVK
jgi:DMSO/TMAO reductase YedYZ molybdopterin-dependent catalytic subunit